MSGVVSTATFRTLGSAATPQNLFSIFNSGTARIARIRSLIVQVDVTVELAAVMPIIRTSRITTAPTGGTVLTKNAWDTADGSQADIVARGATASDGGAATAITSTAGSTVWQTYGMRLHTAVGQVFGPDKAVLSPISETFPLLLRQNQGVLIQIVAAAGTSNPATNHWIAQAAWDEVLP